MGGKAKWRKLKRVVGPASAGTPALAKQYFKKERTKTRDAKRRRMGDAGEEDDEETDATADGSKKDPKPPKDPGTKSSSKKESSKTRSAKSPAKTSDKDAVAAGASKDPEAAESTKGVQEANGIEDLAVLEAPQVMVTDLDKDLDSPVKEGLQKPTSDETLKEELRKATEEECPGGEDTQDSETVENDTDTGATETASQETSDEILLKRKSTQTDAVDMNNVEKPVKFFISDDSDSDTAIFVDANQGGSNGANGQVQENAVAGTGEASGTGDIATTQLIDVESSDSVKASTVQKARFLPSLAHPVKTETQKMHTNLRGHGQTMFPFDQVAEGDNVSRSSASDSVDTVSITRSSVSDLADQDNISKTSTSESADQDGLRKGSTSDSVDLDTTSVTSINESMEHETVSKVYITESGEQETMTISTAGSIDADVSSKMSTVESANPGTISNSSTRGSMDQDVISKSSVSESGETDGVSRTSASESGEQEAQSKTSCSEYEEAEGTTRTSASESGEPDSTSRTSVSESGELDGTSRTSASESVEEHSKATMSVTGTSASATGEYMSSKSSVSYSSEFDAESLSSTADLLTPKEEVSVGDVKAKPGIGESATIERESPTGTPEAPETTEDRPSSPGWEELNLEDHMQLTEEGGVADQTPPKGGKGETEADAESVFFSLYPEYQPGEVDESQDVTKVTTGNPKVLCFRGQTPEQGESQEEIYMAAEKREGSRIKEGRNNGSVTGKISQLQHKLSQQKKSEREDKEIPEPEGRTAQQSGSSNSEQQDAAEQKSEGSPKQGRSEPSPDSTGGRSLSDVPDSSSASSIATATDAKKAEHAIGKKTDDLVCLPGQLGERIEKLADTAEVVVETITDLVQGEAPNAGADVGQEGLEAEGKLEGNAKDRKTLVGKARDWIKGVTRMGGKKDDANDKSNEKSDAKKGDADTKSELESKSSTNGTRATSGDDNPKDAKQEEKGEESAAAGAEVSEEEREKQNGESDSTAIKENGTSLYDQAAETEEAENLKNANKDEQATGTEDKMNGEKNGTEHEKAETESTKEAVAEETAGEGKADEAQTKDEGLFDIVGPEEELSDTVFKDDTVEENGKAKDSDDTEVQDMKTEESAGTGEEKATPLDKEELAEATTQKVNGNSKNGTNAKDEKEASAETISQAEVEKQDNLESISKESEASFVSVQEGIEPEVIPNTIDAAQDEAAEKQRKGTKDEFKPRRKWHEKSKSPSAHKEGGKVESPRTPKRDREGKSGSKKRRHRRRTKSQEDPSNMTTPDTPNPVKGAEEPRPEEVALPSDDFESEKDPPQQEGKEESENVTEKKNTGNPEGEEAPVLEEGSKEATMPIEKKKVSSKSSRDKKHTKKGNDLASGETEHKRHSRSRREKSTEKQDVEKPEKDTQKSKEKIGSPREKLQSESEGQPSFTASAATWSPRVGRRDRKSTKKSSDRKREGQSSDIAKTPKNEEPESPAPSKDSQDGGDDDSSKKSPKPVKRMKGKKPPELSLTITEPRDDTPIPSPKSLSQDASQESALKGTQPLMQALTFPPGVSQPISPLPPTKELKFPLGVSKPKSPLPPTSKELKFPPGVSKPKSPLPVTSKELKFPLGVSVPKSPAPHKTRAPKPIPAPLILKPDAEPSKLLSPLKTLTFPEGVTKPISPLSKKSPQLLPKPVPSSLEAEKPLPYPAKPVSPLKMLHFPEGIPKPVSPAPTKPQEPAFAALSATPKAAESVPVDKEIEIESPKEATPSEKIGLDTEEVPDTSTHKKPRPRITIPIAEPSSSQAIAVSTEAGKLVFPLKTLKFPEGISKPVSPTIQKGQQSVFKLAEKIEKVTAEALKPIPDSTKKDLPMTEAAKPLSPLRIITFPECLAKPTSPTPQKVTPPLIKPKPIPPALELPKATDETEAPQVDKKATTEPSPAVDQVSKPCPGTLTVLTFPEGVSKPISPLPQKTKFSHELFKTTTTTEKGALPSTELINATKDSVKAPLIPDDFFKTIHPGEKPPSLLRTKPAIPAKDSLKISDIEALKSIPPDRSSPVKTFKFPEGVSIPASPLPVKGRSSFGTSESPAVTQKEQKDASAPAPSTTERHTVFTFSQSPKQSPKPEESTKILLPASPTLQKVRPSTVYVTKPSSEPISPSPIKIKHTVDFPSDTFPCTKTSSPLIKSATSLTKAPSPTPKITSTTPKLPSPVGKPASPLPKISSPLTKVDPALPKPITPTTDAGVTGTTEATPALPSPKSEPRFPKSILTTRLKYSQEAAKGDTPDQTLKTKLESLKSSLKPSSPERSPRSTSDVKTALSQTHLTYSESSKRFTPSPRLPDEINREITATPPMTPPPELEHPIPTKEKSSKISAATIQTSEVRSAAKYSRGECKTVKGKSPLSEDNFVTKDSSKSAAEGKTPSTSETSERKEKGSVRSSSGVRRLCEIHQSAQDGIRSSPDITRSRQEDGSQSPSKKLRRRKRR